MGPVTYVAAAASLGLVVMTGLYLDKRDDLAMAIADCNQSKLAEVIVAEKAVRQTLEEAYERKRAEWVVLYKAKEEALKEARSSRDKAEWGSAEREDRIRKLTLQVEESEEIPDSTECLNVSIPVAALDWMPVTSGANCSEAGDSGSTGGDSVCTDSGGFDRAFAAAGAFSSITYSDGMILWGRDRDTVEILNGRLNAIRHLSDQLADE